MNELILGLFWVVYYLIHSAMASQKFKQYLQRTAPVFYPYYRAVYSLFAAINLFLILRLHFIVRSELIFEPGYWRFIGLAFCLCSIVVIVLALKSYGSGFFFREEKSKHLNRTGLNAYVRHPLYFGILLLLIGIFLVAPNWKNLVLAVTSVLYLILGSLLEERKLIDEFGREYLAYRKEVKMLIPWVV